MARPAAAALIHPLAWELHYAAGVALKRKKLKNEELSALVGTVGHSGVPIKFERAFNIVLFMFTYFGGRGLQWLCMGSQFPDQGLSLGLSGESAKS